MSCHICGRYQTRIICLSCTSSWRMVKPEADPLIRKWLDWTGGKVRHDIPSWQNLK